MIAALSLMTALLIVLTPGHAWAECDVLDTSCVAGTVEDTTDDVVGTVEDVADTVDETVDDAVDQVEDEVEDVVEDVEETVNDVEETVNEGADKVRDDVDGAIDDVEDAVDTVDPVVPVTPGGPEPGNDPPGDGSRPDTDGSIVRPDGDDASAPTLELDLLADTAPASGTVVATAVAATSPLDPFGPFAGSLPDVARRLAFPLVLVGLVLGFVAVQNRLDRKDPKLALATTTPDVLSFG